MKRLTIEEAVQALGKGELVVVPTETVYGLAADGLNEQAVRALYEVKGRHLNKPIMLQVSHTEMLSEIVTSVPAFAQILIEKYWPGPVSIVLKKKSGVSNILSAGTNTIGIRMPNQPKTLQIIEKLGRPLAVPSANISGAQSPVTVQEVEQQLEGLEIAGIVDGGDSQYGVESTIVDLTEEKPKILREGAISGSDILRTLNK
jgi:L-threonylcarbamoyladenylate synthase